MLEVAHSPGGSDDTSISSGRSPGVALNAVNNWVPHNIVMRDTWFPLAHAAHVGKKPVRRAIYSHPYFIWREDGKAVASEFHPNERHVRAKSTYRSEEQTSELQSLMRIS